MRHYFHVRPSFLLQEITFIFSQAQRIKGPPQHLQIIVRCIGDRHIDGTCRAYDTHADMLKSKKHMV